MRKKKTRLQTKHRGEEEEEGKKKTFKKKSCANNVNVASFLKSAKTVLKHVEKEIPHLEVAFFSPVYNY